MHRMTPEQQAMFTPNPDQLIDDIDITENHATLGRLVQESIYYSQEASGFSKHKGDLMLHINGEINIAHLLADLDAER